MEYDLAAPLQPEEKEHLDAGPPQSLRALAMAAKMGEDELWDAKAEDVEEILAALDLISNGASASKASTKRARPRRVCRKSRNSSGRRSPL